MNRRLPWFLCGFALAAMLAYPGLLAARHVRDSLRAEAPTAAGPYRLAFRHQIQVDRSRSLPSGGVLFFGDSITDYWADSARWERDFAPLGAVNCGIVADTSSNLLWRIRNGAVANSPRAVVILIGTNDVGILAPPAEPPELAERILAIVEEVRRRAPEARVILFAITPREESDRQARIDATNAILKSAEGFTLLDVGSRFRNGDGSIDKSLLPDGLHPSTAGYDVLADAVLPLLSEQAILPRFRSSPPAAD